MASHLSNRVVEILTPSFGKRWAEVQVKLCCGWAFLDYENLTAAQLPKLADVLEQRCRSTLGTKVAKELKDKILSLN